jgi:hypothetical protein
MAENKFTIYPGKFLCRECKEEVKSMRLWFETGDATWMCSQKHLSKVQLVQVKKKKKKDFIDE